MGAAADVVTTAGGTVAESTRARDRSIARGSAGFFEVVVFITGAAFGAAELSAVTRGNGAGAAAGAATIDSMGRDEDDTNRSLRRITANDAAAIMSDAASAARNGVR